MGNNSNEKFSDNPPSERDELLQRIHEEWTKLIHLIQDLNEDEMTIPTTGGWSIKDHLAHITAWEWYLCEHHIRRSPAHEVHGMDADTYEQADEDDINEFLLQKYKDLTASQIFTDLLRTHQAMLSILEGLSFSELMKPRREDHPDGKALLYWVIANTSDHYKEHRHSIERFIHDVKK